jgi:hypothetical protein
MRVFDRAFSDRQNASNFSFEFSGFSLLLTAPTAGKIPPKSRQFE